MEQRVAVRENAMAAKRVRLEVISLLVKEILI
jgi:hypothetical protein